MTALVRNGTAAAVLTAAGIAGWCSIAAPEGAQRNAVVASLPDNPVGPSPPPLTMKRVSLPDLEQRLRETLDSEAGSFSGERLEELCRLNDTPGLPPVDRARAYAKAWGERHPEQLFEWLQRRGRGLRYNSPWGDFTDASYLFKSWAVKDPAAAIKGALACGQGVERGSAMAQIVDVLRKTDPARAAALAAEHIGLLEQAQPGAFNASRQDYRESLAFIGALPAGKTRDALLAGFFNVLVLYHRNESAQIWNELPDETRRRMVAGGFLGTYLGGDGKKAPVILTGLTELRREYAETSGDPRYVSHWLRNGALEWAAQEPAAAITWAQANLKGEQRVDGTAKMFFMGAATDFETTVRTWHELPEGVLKARAAGNLAAGAPAERQAEVKDLFQTLTPGDLKAAVMALREAAESQNLRVVRDGMRKRVMEGSEAGR